MFRCAVLVRGGLGVNNGVREQQFSDLVGRHQIQLMGYVYAMVHNLDDAEDICQQTSIVLWEKFDDYVPDTDFLAWAATIARYEVLNFVRKKKARDRYFSEALITDIAAAQNEAEASERSDRLAVLADCVKKLSTADRRLVKLCYASARTTVQIAAELGRSAESVYGSLGRIRRTLFRCVTRALSEGDNE